MKTRRIRLGELGEWGSGGTPLSSRADFYGGEIPWLIIEDLNDDLVESAAKTITQKGLEGSSAKMVSAGTLLIAMYGSIGKLGIAGFACATNQAIAFCQCDESVVETKYLFFRLLNERPILLRAGRGGTQQNLTQEFLKDYTVDLPPLPEQRRIATQLEAADRLLRTRRYTLELSDSFLPATFRQLFGDWDHALTKWPNQMLEEAVEPERIVTYGIVQAGPHVPDGVPYVRTGDIVNGEILVKQLLRTSPEIAMSYERSTIQAGDIVMSIRATVGTVALVPASLDGGNLTQGTARIASGPELDPLFLLWQIRSEGAQRWISQQVKGSTFQEITLSRLREMPVFIPPLAQQQHFATLVTQHERLRATQRESLRQAEHLFQTLLHRAFSTP